MRILVTAATANIGRRVVDHLIDLGANDIRALTKNPAKANLPDGVTPMRGYLGEPDSLPAALDGVDAMYLAPLPSTLDITLELIADANVGYVVALSGGAHWQQHTDKVAASGLVSASVPMSGSNSAAGRRPRRRCGRSWVTKSVGIST